jgi:hypothetical protein
MERSTVDRIKGWDRQEVGDGRAGLSRLGDTGFSGAVDAGGMWIFGLNGRIVGTTGGSVDDIGATDPVTAYTAPHPSLPLLFAMRERGGEPQGRYFTDDTALAEAHDTLSSGSFTGYIELSEKVHSGDYYIVYYGGRALFVAFVGTSDRLVTGDEAFERANDEVGIYEINPVDLEVRDPPDPATDAGNGSMAAEETTDDPPERSPDPDSGVTQGQTGEGEPPGGETGPEVETADDPVEGLRDPDPDAGHGRIEADRPSEGEAGEGSGADPEDTDPSEGDTGADDGSPETPDEAPGGRANTEKTGTEPDRIEGPRSDPTATTEGDQSRGRGSASPEPSSRREGERRQKGTGGLLGPDRDGVPWDDGQTIPALDPERTAVPAGDADARPEGSRRSDPGSGNHSPDPTPTGRESAPRSGGQDPKPDSERGSAGSETGDTEERVSADRVAELEAEIEKLRDRVESLNADRTAGERDRMAEERPEVESAGEFISEGAGDEESLTRREALAEADVFVRYDSGSRPTLADAHGGSASLEAVGENRQLEIHTRFDTDAVTVDGEPFESFLRETLAYRFVAWLTGEFLFEIRDGGNETVLGDVYDAIPEIDRAEFDETVTGHGDEGEEPGTVFDIVLRNKTGEPLFLVDVDEGRDPTRGRLMSELLDRSRHVAEAEGSVAGVFLITSSFFDANAHEVVREATKSGFFDRDSRASFVKISRNTGYHACLIEARDGGFHLSRPDI